jgi:hypothetical protein
MFQPAGGPGGEGGRLGHQRRRRQRYGQVGKSFLKMRGYSPFKSVPVPGIQRTYHILRKQIEISKSVLEITSNLCKVT